jgi:hypothetical protein
MEETLRRREAVAVVGGKGGAAEDGACGAGGAVSVGSAVSANIVEAVSVVTNRNMPEAK